MDRKIITSAEFLKLHTESTKTFKQLATLQGKAARCESDVEARRTKGLARFHATLDKLKTTRLAKLHNEIARIGDRHMLLLADMASTDFRAAEPKVRAERGATKARKAPKKK